MEIEAKRTYEDVKMYIENFDGTYQELKSKMVVSCEDDNLFDFYYGCLTCSVYCEDETNPNTKFWLGDTCEVYNNDGVLMGRLVDGKYIYECYYEWCSHCEHENAFPIEFKPHKCNCCGETIFPCSICTNYIDSDTGCDNCPFDE